MCEDGECAAGAASQDSGLTALFSPVFIPMMSPACSLRLHQLHFFPRGSRRRLRWPPRPHHHQCHRIGLRQQIVPPTALAAVVVRQGPLLTQSGTIRMLRTRHDRLSCLRGEERILLATSVVCSRDTVGYLWHNVSLARQLCRFVERKSIPVPPVCPRTRTKLIAQGF